MEVAIKVQSIDEAPKQSKDQETRIVEIAKSDNYIRIQYNNEFLFIPTQVMEAICNMQSGF